MIEDQIEYEIGINVEDMRRTENDLYSALCTLYTGIHYTLSSSIESFVDRSAMPSYIRDAGSETHSIRQNRNYVIAKDATAILDYLSQRYDFMYTQLSSMMLS
ncbi:hypothetical protein FSP39_004436 [Pinctada imbricata]|uniref:Uncharacterized protein n=1 Tax=Pinctada imbricata TaxID=66713 RepID=A0AA89BKK5_PINIB|nr:hypothetical protein FSP39_004436 [Pinctada imbricata]